VKNPKYKFQPGDDFPRDWHVWDYYVEKARREVIESRMALEESKEDLKRSLEALRYFALAVAVCVLVGIFIVSAVA
jgi:hypothetical protein